MKRCILFLLITLFPILSWGQKFSPVFENITDGLPSTEVHDMFQDSIGFMWFATDRGICKYDGERFQKFNENTKLKTKVIYKFYKEREDKVWLLTGKNTFFWFNPYAENIDFYPLKQNVKLRYFFAKSLAQFNISRFKRLNGQFTIFFQNSVGYLTISDKAGIQFISGPRNSQTAIGGNIELNVSSANAYTQISDEVKQSFNNYCYLIANEIKIPLTLRDNVNRYNNVGIKEELRVGNSIYLAIGDFIFLSQNGKTKFMKLPHRILSILKTKKRVYVGTENGVYELNLDLKLINSFLEGNTITKLYLDKNRNIWAGSLQNGIFLVSSLIIDRVSFGGSFLASDLLFRKKENLLQLYDAYEKQIMFLDENNRIKGTFGQIPKYQNFLIDNQGDLYHFLLKVNPSFLAKNILFPNGKKSYQIVSNVDLLSKHPVYRGYLLSSWREVNKPILQLKGINTIRFNYVHTSDKSLIGTENGLFWLDSKNLVLDERPIPGSQNLNFISIIKIGGKLILLSDNGVYHFDGKRLNLKKKIFADQFKGIVKQNDHKAWAYGDDHLLELEVINERIRIRRRVIYLGYKSPIIMSIAIVNEVLWLATKKGLFRVNGEHLLTQSEPKKLKFVMNGIRIGSKKVRKNSELNIFTNEPLHLSFQTVTYDRRIDRTLEYSIDGRNWYETNKYDLILQIQKVGKTNLQIRKAGDDTQVLFSLPIYVKDFFYNKAWFQLTVLIVILGVSYFLMRIYFLGREKKRKMETEKLALELKLLTSKMNPHFTFNTINSIQHYILKSNKKEALIYLSEFALLMRKSLEFSMEERITIDQEKEFLELYLALENKRFSTDFQLEFEVDSSINRMEKKIPSMLIQPLVENIVLHANYKLNDPKRIKIQIQLLSGFFHITVRDFGKGIPKNNQISVHKSYGLEIIKSRVKMYNSDDFTEDDFHVYTYNSDEEKGTLVSLRIKEWV